VTLEEDRDFLLRSLRDLEDEHAAGDLDDADYAALKDEYTAKAAAVLRQLEAPELGLRTIDTSPARAAVRKRGRGRVVAAVVALAIVSGGAGYAVAQSSGERLAGDEATGDLPEGSVDRITKAQALVADRKILEAVKVYDELLADDPGNPVALAQRGWLVSQVDPSLVDSGLASIDRAIASDPTYPDAHFFRGMILLLAKDEPALAVESFERALAANPPEDVKQVMEAQLERAKAAAAERASATP
jgi:tetratricopeptide (TPR) repeat protein